MTLKLTARLPLVQKRIAEAPRLLVGLDYDGTLTPLVDHPRKATLAPETRDVLRSLARRPNTCVAIISGRSLDDLRDLVRVDGLTYAGNHGLDISGPGRRFIETSAVNRVPQLTQVGRALQSSLGSVPGAMVEDKSLTLCVHVRQAAPLHRVKVRSIVQSAIAQARREFRMRPGSNAYEVIPRVDWHKGRALRWIQEQMSRANAVVMYFGDDQTDEDVFREVREGITVKVGLSGPTSAGFFLDSPAEVTYFLKWLDSLGADGRYAH